MIYFRQDVWQRLAGPALCQLRNSIFKRLGKVSGGECTAPNAVDSHLVTALEDENACERSLGCSLVRILPKTTGYRPIMNLRRKACCTSSRLPNRLLFSA